jgi:hypothetical protein
MGRDIPNVVAADELACAVLLESSRLLLWRRVLLQRSRKAIVVISTVPGLVHLGHEIATRRGVVWDLGTRLWKVL